MDRLQALRDTANLPRAVALPLCPPSTDHSMNDSGLDMRVDDSLTDMQWLQRMDAGKDYGSSGTSLRSPIDLYTPVQLCKLYK